MVELSASKRRWIAATVVVAAVLVLIVGGLLLVARSRRASLLAEGPPAAEAHLLFVNVEAYKKLVSARIKRVMQARMAGKGPEFDEPPPIRPTAVAVLAFEPPGLTSPLWRGMHRGNVLVPVTVRIRVDPGKQEQTHQLRFRLLRGKWRVAAGE